MASRFPPTRPSDAHHASTPTLDADDPHVGLIQFKVGAGGEAVRYIGEWDLLLWPMVYRARSAS